MLAKIRSMRKKVNEMVVGNGSWSFMEVSSQASVNECLSLTASGTDGTLPIFRLTFQLNKYSVCATKSRVHTAN
jgi:hypothetical protein